jgi:hypothetical protein
MDDEPGKVIDGTARARHWRRSQPDSAAERNVPQNHSEAPKSIASSLLVPPAIFEGEAAPLAGEEPPDGDGLTAAASRHAPDVVAAHRNLFLSLDAAEAPPPDRRSRVLPAVFGLVNRARGGRLGILPRPSRRLSRNRAAALLGLIAASAIATTLTLTLSSSPAPPAVGTNSALGFNGLKRTLLSSAESAFAAVPKTPQLRVSAAFSLRRSTHHARQDRRKAVRMVSRARSGGEVVSERTSTRAVPAVASHDSSSQSTTPGSGGPAEQPPTQQTIQPQQVHYQSPSQPVGPAGLGSQVGGSCDPKCS